jgi:hypothetical protein
MMQRYRVDVDSVCQIMKSDHGDFVLYSAAQGEIEAIKKRIREIDNERVQFGAMLDSIDMILSNGEEPSDFMMSFPLVRATWDLAADNAALRAEVERLKEALRRIARGSDDVHVDGEKNIPFDLYYVQLIAQAALKGGGKWDKLNSGDHLKSA